jgi:diguanylate cyclase (GGDEF)-like protein/PAS domain S-box-containing protein
LKAGLGISPFARLFLPVSDLMLTDSKPGIQNNDQLTESQILQPGHGFFSVNLETKYRIFFEGSADAIFLMKEIFWDCNDQACRLLQYSCDEIVGHHPSEFSPPFQPDGRPSEEAAQGYIHLALAGHPQYFPWIHRRSDGSLVDCEVSLKKIILENEDFVLATVRDISGRVAMQKALQESQQRLIESEILYRTVVNASPDAIAVTDLEGNLEFFSPQALALLNLPKDADIIGQNILNWVIPLDRQRARENIRRVARGEKIGVSTYQVQHEHRTPFYMETNTAVICDSAGKPARLMIIARDISERVQAEMELQYLSTHDVLTGMYNRSYFEKQMESLRYPQHFPVSVVMIDVDGLKPVNDNFGHSAGDALLKKTAHVLNSVFRQQDTIARVGGDEFAVLLPETDQSAACELYDRIHTVLRKHQRAADNKKLHLSIGVATEEADRPLTEALHRADEQMYAEKKTHPRRRKSD